MRPKYMKSAFKRVQNQEDDLQYATDGSTFSNVSEQEDTEESPKRKKSTKKVTK